MSTQGRAANQQMLQHLAQHYGIAIYYEDREQRAAYASALARQADLPEDVVHFALLGDERYDLYGAARNALLLDTLDELCVQVDDDTVCKIATMPEARAGLRLHTRGRLFDHQYFATYQAVLDALTFEEKDFLGLHETLLGKDLATCIDALEDPDKMINIDAVDDVLFQHTERHQLTVALSFLGTAGDAGASLNLYRLFSEGDEHQRLIRDETSYHVLLNTRYLLRGSAQPTISNSPACFTINIGLDNRTFIPPFMPILRGEDNDLEGDLDEKRKQFHTLLNQFGDLLICWPALTAAARALRLQDRRLARKV